MFFKKKGLHLKKKKSKNRILIVTFDDVGISFSDGTKETPKGMVSKKITKIQCLFRTSECLSDI